MSKIAKKIILKAANMNELSADELNALKRMVLRGQEREKAIPTTKELLKAYHILLKTGKIKQNQGLEKLLIKRAIRTLSGVTIITVLTKPFPCPGKCIYCPTEDRMPKSYISDEPAAARALKLQFDPYEQVARRIKTLHDNGHPTDKIELIVKGGTWNAYPPDYQYWFINECYRACNKLNQKSKRFATLTKNKNQKILIEALRKKLNRSQNTNEQTKHRVIGLTLETRPDYINENTIGVMRELGCTRIELGVQTTDDRTLKLVKRGHTSEQVKTATKFLKDHGFKVDYHLMPQLPGSTPKKDLQMMQEIFKDPDYRPDMIKIYPCTVIKNTELYRWLKKGEYKPYSDKKLIETLIQFKTVVPRYARISRLIRDIPGHHVEAGNKVTNLRQVIQSEMRKRGLKCNCLRCLEVGHVDFKTLKHKNIKTKPFLFVDRYEASGGTEYFLSFEDSGRNVVYAFCRLRIVSHDTNVKAFIRELHTYGQALNIGKRESNASQHKGLGKKLIEEAEKICRRNRGEQNKVSELEIISSVGVRDYYRKMGYRLKNTYMVKMLK